MPIEPLYRLVTRADFDGLVCAALLKEMALIDEIIFVHPKDVADGTIDITDRDITTNLPYDERCYLAFDHHASEMLRHQGNVPDNLILDSEADSAARVVYRYYGGHDRFRNISPEMLMAVDKADAARFTEEEVLNPSGWVLLNFIMDPRTGLGRYDGFRIPNFELMMRLIEECRLRDVEEILQLPDVQERVELYFSHAEQAVEQIRRCAKAYGNVVVLDLRDEETIYACNRFMIYTLYPQCSVSIHVLWGRYGLNTVFAIGNSIFNRSSPVNIGEVCMKHGGGGHESAGTCQVEHADVERVLPELLEQFNAGETPMLVTADDCEELDEDFGGAEEILIDTLAEGGSAVLATQQDVREIRRRLEQIEAALAEMAVATTTH